jgi:tyrosinase
MGGDPGRDLYTSPGDPLFYLHHVSSPATSFP